MNTKEQYPFFSGDAPEEEVEAIITMAESEEAALMDDQWIRLESAWSSLWSRMRANGRLQAWLVKASDDQIKALADALPLKK